MSTMLNITLSELQFFLKNLALPSETRLKIAFEDSSASAELLKRTKALEAMRKLKGTGNGNLVNALLQEREKTKKVRRDAHECL